jgi:hypothetical protein
MLEEQLLQDHLELTVKYNHTVLQDQQTTDKKFQIFLQMMDLEQMFMIGSHSMEHQLLQHMYQV